MAEATSRSTATATAPRAPAAPRTRRLGRPGAPLSAASAHALMRQWRPLGACLSVWDVRGRMVGHDGTDAVLWLMLARRCPEFREGMRRCARLALRTGEVQSASPWGPSILLAAFPVVERSRTAGALLAVTMTAEPDDTFGELCCRGGVDPQVARRTAAELPRLPAELSARWRGLLSAMIDQSRRHDDATRRIDSFTRNLSDTYEELSLIYGVSGMLTLHDPPAQVLERVAEEARTVSRTAGMAFILRQRPIEATTEDEAAPPAFEQVMHGNVALSAVEIGRLADELRLAPRPAAPGATAAADMPPQIVQNDLASEPGREWLRGRVRHVVGFPLISDDCWYGAMLALDRTRGDDFSSIEIKFLRAVADRLTAYLENHQLYEDLAQLLMGLLHALIRSIDAKDPYTCGHSERVAAMARRIAQQAGWPAIECQRAYMAGLLHDVGKIGVPDAILCKPGKLTDAEFTILRKHPEIGARILAGIREVRDLLPGVLHHHERMDGRGYPARLAGNDIPALGRVICLADCFDAMTTSRTYRAALPATAALAEVRRCAGTQFDPQLAAHLLEIDVHELLALGPAAAERDRAARGEAEGAPEVRRDVPSRDELSRIVRDWQRGARRRAT